MKTYWSKTIIKSIFIIAFIISGYLQANASSTKVYDLTVNFEKNPIGIETDNIKFSWKMKSNLIGQAQEKYQIIVTEKSGNEIWNSGETISDKSVAIPYEGPDLKFETQYKWNVTVTCSNGEIIKSETNSFETGTDFENAEWIYYKRKVDNCFKSSINIGLKPTIIEDGFTLYFGIKNQENKFEWTFTTKSLSASKINASGNSSLDVVDLSEIVSANIPFELSVTITNNKILTVIDGKEISSIKHSYSIERPYVGLMVSEQQMNRRTREITRPAQTARFENFILTVDGEQEQIGEQSFTLEAPIPDPNAQPRFGPRGGGGGVTFYQTNYKSRPVEYEEESTKMPLFRTEQVLSGKVKSARLYISSLGIFDAFINGKEVKQLTNDGKILDDIFSPGWTNYNDYLYYRTYDVSSYIEGDKIAFGAMLGNGWYGGLIGREYYHEIGEAGINEPALIAKLCIYYEDGSQQVITTNTEEWTVSEEGPVILNDFFIGEIYDARLEKNIEGWNNPGFDDSGWKKVNQLTDFNPQLTGGDENTAYMLEEYRINPKAGEDTYIFDPENINFSSDLKFGSVVPEKVDPEKKITLNKGKKLMVDLGQNIAGVTGIRVSGPEGTQIRLQGAEMLNDGKNNPNHESGAGSCGPKGTLYLTGLTRDRHDEKEWYTDVYYLNDKEIQDYRASYTFHGYRYLEISTDNDVVIHKIYAQPITSVTKQTGNIITNNENVNQLFKNSLWSQMGNHITIPTDCPNRSERLGWSGDITVFAETALYNFDAFNFMNNYMEIASNYAENNDGRFGTTMPGPSNGAAVSSGGFGGGGRTNAGWTDVGIILTWALFQQTGDISVLEKNYDLLAAYMDEVIEDDLRAGYGDWVALQTTSGTFMAGVYQAYDALLMSKIAEEVGNYFDVKKYKIEYERMREILAEKYVDNKGNLLSVTADNITNGGFLSTGIIQDNSQTSILWALKMQLYNSEEEKQTFIKNLLTNIDNEGGSIRKAQGEKTLSTGFLGVNVLLPVLTENGLASSAYDLLLQDEMPSWLYEVKQGATTTWERWNAYSHINSFEDNGMNSFNHYAYGAVTEWMFEYMAGIQKDEKNPGFKNVILQPIIDNGSKFNNQERINRVTGEYESYYGKITSGWSAKDGNLVSYSVTIPANTTATLFLPVGKNLTNESLDNFESIPGISFKEITLKNGLNVAEFQVLSGAFLFEIENGKLQVSSTKEYVLK